MRLTISQHELRLLGAPQNSIDLESNPVKRSRRARRIIPRRSNYGEDRKKKTPLPKFAQLCSHSPQIALCTVETVADGQVLAFSLSLPRQC